MTLKALVPGHVKSVTLRNLTRFRASGLRYMEKQRRLAEEAKARQSGKRCADADENQNRS